jgi:uncharacterized membrane protein
MTNLKSSRISPKRISLYAMVMFYIAAGINHVLYPEFYYKIMPPWLGWHHTIILISGLIEVLLALLLLRTRTRRFAAYCILVFLVAVFPANVQMAINYYYQNEPGLWLALIRLPFQIVLIWWAYTHSKPGEDGTRSCD